MPIHLKRIKHFKFIRVQLTIWRIEVAELGLKHYVLLSEFQSIGRYLELRLIGSRLIGARSIQFRIIIRYSDFKIRFLQPIHFEHKMTYQVPAGENKKSVGLSISYKYLYPLVSFLQNGSNSSNIIL